MTIKQRFFELLDNISIEGVDITLGFLLFFMIFIVALRYGKKDDGKTIFNGGSRRMDTFDKKGDNEGFV